jgi:hypothetical protein
MIKLRSNGGKFMWLQLAALVLGASFTGAASAEPPERSMPPTSSSAQAIGELGLFEFLIDSPLALPVCVEPGATDAISAFPSKHSGSEVTCRFRLNDTNIVRVSDKTHATSLYLRQDFQVVLMGGKIVGMRIATAGEGGVDRAFKVLKDKFGEPSSFTAESGAGEDFKPASAEWRRADGIVHFAGGAPGYRVGLVEIETLAFHERPMPIPSKTGDSGLAPRPKATPAMRAASSMMTSAATGVELNRIRWILDIDETALKSMRAEDRQAMIELRNGYMLMDQGAQFLISPMWRKALSAPVQPRT